MQYLCTRNSEMSQSLMNMQRGVAQLGSASGLGPGGRRFESCHPDFCLTLQRKRDVKCGNSSVGRARPCQGRGREFESRLPLFDILIDLDFSKFLPRWRNWQTRTFQVRVFHDVQVRVLFWALLSQNSIYAGEVAELVDALL